MSSTLRRLAPRILAAAAIGSAGLAWAAAPPPAPHDAVERARDAWAQARDVPEPRSDPRRRLLDAALDAASKLPAQPHLKDKGRLQYRVFAAALAIDRPVLARRYVARIDNWRRGVAFAEYARYCVLHGVDDRIEAHLKMAEATSHLVAQDWRRESILLPVAQTRMLLDDDEAVERFRGSLTLDTHRGAVEAFRAEADENAAYDAMVARFDELIGTNRYEAIVNSLAGLVRLYERHYDDAARRAALESKIRAALEPLPGLDRIETLEALAEAALGHGDRASALARVDEADGLASDLAWPDSREYRYERMSGLAILRARAGDAAGARARLDALADRLERTMEDALADFRRPDALRPLAEAYHATGDTPRALAVYRVAIEQGMKNKNGRPRAMDLSTTCVSMAVHGVEPTPDLWTLLDRANEALKSPW